MFANCSCFAIRCPVLTFLAAPVTIVCASGLAMVSRPWPEVACAAACLALAAYAARLWHAAGRTDLTGGLLVPGLALVAAGQIAALIWPAHRAAAMGLPVLALGGMMLVLLLRRGFALSPGRVAAILALSGMGMLAAGLGIGPGALVVLPLALLYLLGVTLVMRARLGMHRDSGLKGQAAARSDQWHFPRLKLGYALIQAGILIAVALVVRAFDRGACAELPYAAALLWRGLGLLATATLVLALLRQGMPALATANRPASDSATIPAGSRP